jgi:hypothetical protein
MKKPHKFFDVFLENDLQKLYDFLITMDSKILKENVLNLKEEKLAEFKILPGAMTRIGVKDYNIFSFVNPEIYNLQLALRELTKTACEYYEINFEKEQYFIHGWFNLDESPVDKFYAFGGVNPKQNPYHFHDHSDGQGVPWFHGYYCVNAEPSSTFYKIDRDENNIFENINKNNRAIISETGHPHGRDDWFEEKPRITIAYDITPAKQLAYVDPNIWNVL